MLCSNRPCAREGVLVVTHVPPKDDRRHTDVLCRECKDSLDQSAVVQVQTVEEMNRKYGDRILMRKEELDDMLKWAGNEPT